MFKSISNMCEFEKKIVSKEMFEKKSSKHKVILFYFYEHQVLKHLKCSSILKLCDIVLQVPLISMLISMLIYLFMLLIKYLIISMLGIISCNNYKWLKHSLSTKSVVSDWDR